jgi:hypothetical protein
MRAAAMGTRRTKAAAAGQHAEGRPHNPLRRSVLAQRLWSRSCDRFVSGLGLGRRLRYSAAARPRAGKTTPRNSGSVAKPPRQELGVWVSPTRSRRAGPMPWRGAIGLGQPLVPSGTERPQGWVAITRSGLPRSLCRRHMARRLGARTPGCPSRPRLREWPLLLLAAAAGIASSTAHATGAHSAAAHATSST